MYALWNEKWDMAEWLVAKDPDLFRQETADKDTPMTWAAYHGKTNIMQWLKDHGLSISKKASDGNRPIDSAILGNQRESAEWLLNHKISLLEPFHDGASTLMLALTYDKWDMAEWLVTKSPALLRQEDACKHSPMTWAASIGKTNVMQWLKNKGVNLSENNTGSRDALGCAKIYNQPAVLDWLSNQGIRMSAAQAAQPVSYAHNPHAFYAPSSSASRSYAPTYAYTRRDPNEEFRRDMQTAAQLVNAGAKLANGLGNLIDALDGGSQSSFFNM